MFQKIYEDEIKFPCPIDVKIKNFLLQCASVGSVWQATTLFGKGLTSDLRRFLQVLVGSSCTFSQSLYNVKSTIPRCPWNGPVEGLLYIAACSGDHGWKYFHFSDLKPGLEISQIRPELWVGAKRSFGQLFVSIQNHCNSIESNAWMSLQSYWPFYRPNKTLTPFRSKKYDLYPTVRVRLSFNLYEGDFSTGWSGARLIETVPPGSLNGHHLIHLPC